MGLQDCLPLVEQELNRLELGRQPVSGLLSLCGLDGQLLHHLLLSSDHQERLLELQVNLLAFELLVPEVTPRLGLDLP